MNPRYPFFAALLISGMLTGCDKDTEETPDDTDPTVVEDEPTNWSGEVDGTITPDGGGAMTCTGTSTIEVLGDVANGTLTCNIDYSPCSISVDDVTIDGGEYDQEFAGCLTITVDGTIDYASDTRLEGTILGEAYDNALNQDMGADFTWWAEKDD